MSIPVQHLTVKEKDRLTQIQIRADSLEYQFNCALGRRQELVGRLNHILHTAALRNDVYRKDSEDAGPAKSSAEKDWEEHHYCIVELSNDGSVIVITKRNNISKPLVVHLTQEEKVQISALREEIRRAKKQAESVKTQIEDMKEKKDKFLVTIAQRYEPYSRWSKNGNKKNEDGTYSYEHHTLELSDDGSILIIHPDHTHQHQRRLLSSSGGQGIV